MVLQVTSCTSFSISPNIRHNWLKGRMRGCKWGSFSWIRYQRPKLGASLGLLFTISRGGKGEGGSHKKCNPSRTSAHPPTNSLYRNFSEISPTGEKQHLLQYSCTSWQCLYKFILVSLLACKMCPGSLPGSHNPPCSSHHTYPPTTSRDLGSSLPTAGGILCNLVNQL